MKMILLSSSALIAAALAWAATLPPVQELTVERDIPAPPETVWAIVTDWSAQPRWRSGLARVEIRNASEFVEHLNDGSTMQFRVLEQQPARRLVLALSGPATGTYSLQLTPTTTATRLVETYRLEYDGILRRALARLFFNLPKFAAQYLDELEAEVRRRTK